METRQSESGIIIWLTRQEQEDEAVKAHIAALRQSSRVAVFYSGEKRGEEQVRRLILNNLG